MQICSLSSSSTYGNAFLVRSGGTTLLIDCGMSLRRLEQAVAAVGEDVRRIGAVLITHHHRDHTQALRLKGPLAARYGIPVYGSGEFWQAWSMDACRLGYGPLDGLARVIDPGVTQDIYGLKVRAFARPHDASGSVGYVIEGRSAAAAVLTDMGHVPKQLLSELSGVDHLIIEANHDVAMEVQSPRPQSLKNRVLGPLGHLSNEQAAEALSALVTSHTESVLLAHLSLDCNRPSLALEAVSRYLGRPGPRLEVAPADHPSRWMGTTG